MCIHTEEHDKERLDFYSTMNNGLRTIEQLCDKQITSFTKGDKDVDVLLAELKKIKQNAQNLYSNNKAHHVEFCHIFNE